MTAAPVDSTREPAAKATDDDTRFEEGRSFTEPLLEIRGLSVDYGSGPGSVHAVDEVDLVVHRGEALGLAGESGSGKSTLAHAITRLLRPPALVTKGQVLYHGRATTGPGQSPVVDVLTLSKAQLRRFRWEEIAIVFQSAMNALNPVIDIRTQLTDSLAAHRPRMKRKAQSERAAELLELVGVSKDRLRSFPHQLSGGMRQRVMIAMALALGPDLIIMDEPTTALDVVTQRQILEKIEDLRHQFGFATVFITHDLSLLLDVADSIAIMYAGPDGRGRPGAAALLRCGPSLQSRVVAVVSAPHRPAARTDGHSGVSARPALAPAGVPLRSPLQAHDGRLPGDLPAFR